MRRFILIGLTAFFCFNTTISFGQNALNFDGTNDLVQTTFSGVVGAANRTFEAWVYVDPLAPASNLCIMDYGLNAVGSRNTFSVSGGRGLSFISGGTNANIGSAAGVVPVGQWVHVAFVLNNGTGFLYVNGIQVGTGSLTTVNTPSGNQNLKIGQRVLGGSIRFQGSIDEVRVWNVARTAQEIQGDTARELCLVPTGLVAYYRFNQGVAGGTNTGLDSLIEDVAGNNGTLTGFALSGSTSNWISGKTLQPGAPIMVNDTVAACESYTSPSGNQVWTSTGIHMDTIPNPAGCDSIFTIDLTINNNSTGTQTALGCDSVVSPSGKFVYYATGSYLDTISNAVGCDSVITVNVTIPVINDSVTINGNNITAVQNGATYNWFDCSSGYVTIAGAVSQTYTITSSGNYAVSIQMSGCIDTSDCVLAFFVGLEENGLKNLSVYPNPTNGEIYIDGQFEGNLSIMDSKGDLVYETRLMGNSNSSISLPVSIQSGMYFMVFQNDRVNFRRKVLIIRE
jgi:Concanavalin A-like lectin/glucanases superfamily/Secretion system C-terminal sorting domain